MPEGSVLVRMVELYLLGRNCACPNGIVLARKELCLPGKSRPTRLSLFNFRGVCEFSVRTFDPTQISLFYSRGVYKFSFRTFDPTLLLLFISRGVRNFSVHKFDPTRFPFFNSRGAPLPKMNLFLSRGAPPTAKNPRKQHASPEKASTHRSRGSEFNYCANAALPPLTGRLITPSPPASHSGTHRIPHQASVFLGFLPLLAGI